LRDKGSNAPGELRGDLAGPVEVERDEVEGGPLDALQRHRGIGDLPVEVLADHGDRLAQELVDARDDLGAGLPESLGTLGAVGEQRQHVVGGQAERVGREPDLQTELGGQGRGQLQPAGVAAHDADRVAVQVVADDAQLTPGGLGIEKRTADLPLVDLPLVDLPLLRGRTWRT